MDDAEVKVELREDKLRAVDDEAIEPDAELVGDHLGASSGGDEAVDRIADVVELERDVVGARIIEGGAVTLVGVMAGELAALPVGLDDRGVAIRIDREQRLLVDGVGGNAHRATEIGDDVEIQIFRQTADADAGSRNRVVVDAYEVAEECLRLATVGDSGAELQVGDADRDVHLHIGCGVEDPRSRR